MGGGLVFFGIGGDVSGGLFDAFSDRSGGGNSNEQLEDRIDRFEERLAANPRNEAALKALTALREARKPVPGFGHPLHRDGDPRAIRLLSLAHERKVAGTYVSLIEEMATLVPEINN